MVSICECRLAAVYTTLSLALLFKTKSKTEMSSIWIASKKGGSPQSKFIHRKQGSAISEKGGKREQERERPSKKG